MKTYFTVRWPGILLALPLLIPVSLFLSCNKVDLGVTEIQSSFLQKGSALKTNSSVSGFVTDETDQPVINAKVLAGNKICVTDEYGFFELKDADVTADVAVVTIIKTGYFKGIKTFIPVANQDAFFRIKLIPKTIAGNVNAVNGGVVTLTNGLSISFPANSIVSDASGAVYSGTVNVAAFWINPSADDLNKVMPGDLRAMNSNSEMKKLTSYGMAAVELTGTSGEKLQIAPGKNATITMPMSAQVASQAPAILPLWYFDEGKGLWKEQGHAVRKGNVYVGDVSHFSFWNCDTDETFVDFECTVVNEAGDPLNNVLVKITAVNDPNNNNSCYTNAHGYAAGAIPSNKLLRLDVLGDAACGGTPVYTQTFTATNNISLPLIRVNSRAGIASVSGTVKNCNNNPVSKGGIIMQKNGQYYRYAVGKQGAYHFTTILCNSNADVSLMAYDADAAVYSKENNYTITTAANTNIDILACGNSSSQFINYTINDVVYSFTYPAATFAPVTPGSNFTFAVSNDMTNENAGFQCSAINISTNTSQTLSYFMASQANEPLTISSPILVNITEHGTTDQIFAGNFSGIFRGPAPNYTTYNITCSFRVKCQL